MVTKAFANGHYKRQDIRLYEPFIAQILKNSCYKMQQCTPYYDTVLQISTIFAISVINATEGENN